MFGCLGIGACLGRWVSKCVVCVCVSLWKYVCVFVHECVGIFCICLFPSHSVCVCVYMCVCVCVCVCGGR